MDTLPIEKLETFTSEELPPMTLQVVLRGTKGIVIASDTCAASHPDETGIDVTDSNTKMVVKSRFVCTFSGDDFSRYIATEIVAEVGDLGFDNSTKFIDEVNKSLLKYIEAPGFRQTQYRKILWIQTIGNSEFAVWGASYCCGLEGPVFELIDPQVQNRIFAGNEGNPARYFVERYYNPTKTVSGLKKMAALVIRTGHTLNTAGVNGLEMAVGENGMFTKVLPEDLQKIGFAISGIHAVIDAYFAA